MEATRIVAVGLLPILPEKAPEVLAALGAPPPSDLDALAWGGLPTGTELPAVEPIFPRIDKKAYLAGAGDAPPKPAKKAKPDRSAKAAPGPEDEKISFDDFLGQTVLKVAEVKAAESGAEVEEAAQAQRRRR